MLTGTAVSTAFRSPDDVPRDRGYRRRRDAIALIALERTALSDPARPTPAAFPKWMKRTAAICLVAIPVGYCAIAVATDEGQEPDNDRYRECMEFWDPNGIRTEHAREQCGHLRN